MKSRFIKLFCCLALLDCSLGSFFSSEVSAQIRIVPKAYRDSVATTLQRGRQWSEDYLSFDSLAVHTGPLMEDAQPYRTSVMFRNTGSDDILLADPQTSCNCLKAGLDKKLLHKGETAVLELIYYQKGHPGKHDRTIYIYKVNNDDPIAFLTLYTDVIYNK